MHLPDMTVKRTRPSHGSNYQPIEWLPAGHHSKKNHQGIVRLNEQEHAMLMKRLLISYAETEQAADVKDALTCKSTMWCKSYLRAIESMMCNVHDGL